ncbi:hypothetical protein CMU89_05805 [Elizabethkingia anophelis]|uniref:hypothetical protein n=1 Tax=Elizabethkingia anophelis TaxID=1117645 RepID=UPI00293C91F4|nr:hypothetical protein [Elizabethkingia anophelis]MDV3542174.1 hypothetical protein [Elizabethkingia anophelis]
MKTLIIFFIVLVGIFCKSQEIVSTNSKDIKIRSLTKEVSLLVMDSVEIMNNTNVGYLINKKGFHGYSDIYEKWRKNDPDSADL